MILSGRNSVLLRADRGFCCAYKPHDGNLRTTRRCTLFTSCRTFAQPCVSCMFVRLAVQHIPQWHEEQLCIQCHHVFVDSKSVRLSSFRRARLDALIALHIQTLTYEMILLFTLSSHHTVQDFVRPDQVRLPEVSHHVDTHPGQVRLPEVSHDVDTYA